MRNVLVAAGWAWAAMIVWLSLMQEPPELGIAQGDKLGHFAAYGLLMLWFTQLHVALRSRLAHAGVFVAMGVALEFLQGALGYRSYDIIDMGANTLGVALGWAIGAVLRLRFPRPADQPRL